MLCFGILVMVCSLEQPPQIDAARFCKVAAPITWSASDSAETKRQVRVHNAKWKAVCAKRE